MALRSVLHTFYTHENEGKILQDGVVPNQTLLLHTCWKLPSYFTTVHSSSSIYWLQPSAVVWSVPATLSVSVKYYWVWEVFSVSHSTIWLFSVRNKSALCFPILSVWTHLGTQNSKKKCRSQPFVLVFWSNPNFCTCRFCHAFLKSSFLGFLITKTWCAWRLWYGLINLLQKFQGNFSSPLWDVNKRKCGKYKEGTS